MIKTDPIHIFWDKAIQYDTSRVFSEIVFPFSTSRYITYNRNFIP